MKCSGDNNDGPSLLLSDKRFEQEEAMLAIAKASDCEAFHSATVVKITDPDETTKKHLSTARQGEIMVEIDHTAGDDLSEECRMILIDAFSDSFSQVYGVDGMHALIESEQTFPNRDAKQANLQYYGAKWRVYWVSVSVMSPSQHRCVCASPIERHLTNFCFFYASSSCL